MDRRRKTQLVLLIMLNAGFFLVLDLISPMPVVFDASDRIPSFHVSEASTVSQRYTFFIIYQSEQQYSRFNLVEEDLEGRTYGEYIEYQVEFYEEIYDKTRFYELVESGQWMDVSWYIGVHTEEDIKGVTGYLDEHNSFLLTPFISIDRNQIQSCNVLSLELNVSEKARSYSELLMEEGLDHLVIVSNSSIGDEIAASITSSMCTVVDQPETLEAVMSQLDGSRIGVFTHDTSDLTDIKIDSKEVIVYCMTQSRLLNITTKQFSPVISEPERYQQFIEYYTNLTGEIPTYTDALLYDACQIFIDYIETSRYRPWDAPEALWTSAKNIEGVTGNCTLTPSGDRMYQQYILETIEN